MASVTSPKYEELKIVIVVYLVSRKKEKKRNYLSQQPLRGLSEQVFILNINVP